MKARKYCIDQQILNWQYCTVQRYELLEKTTFCAINSSFGPKGKSQGTVKLPALSKISESKDADLVKRNSRTNHAQSSKITKAYLNHIKLWPSITKITLHVTSKKLLTYIELYASLYQMFCCCGNQSPQIVKSKKAVAAFKVMKGVIVGAKSNLRKKTILLFCYKWSYLMPELTINVISTKQQAALVNSNVLFKKAVVGINNVFVFPELDKLDYSAYEPVSGFDLVFNYNFEKTNF